MRDIRQGIDATSARTILGNVGNARRFLSRIGAPLDTSLPAAETYELVVQHWNYATARPVLREMFREESKYRSGLRAGARLEKLLTEWQILGLGTVQWPCSQGQFDQLAQRINNADTSEEEKDEQIKLAAVRFRRIKSIKTARNDLIETLLFDSNDSVIPTFRHTSEGDFFINGIKYDQKTAKSPTTRFQQDFGDAWRAEAIARPGLVAKYLYEDQDPGRFGSDPRLYVVSLDGDGISPEGVREAVLNSSLEHPISVEFTYSHSNSGPREYKTQAIMVLLHD